jgi:anti-sigma factor RsiW
MDHERARDLFTRYHDGDLGQDERLLLEQHLAECDECREEWDSYRRTIKEISGLFKLAPPADFTRDVEQKIRKRSRGRFFSEPRSFSTQFAMVSFILILLFILAYLVMTAATEIFILDDGAPAGESRASARETDAGGR